MTSFLIPGAVLAAIIASAIASLLGRSRSYWSAKRAVSAFTGGTFQDLWIVATRHRRQRYSSAQARQVDAWMSTRRRERLREELIFEEAARRGVLRRIDTLESETTSTSPDCHLTMAEHADPFRQAIRALLTANEQLAETAQTWGTSTNHLMVMREVAFQAESFSADISHSLDEGSAQHDPRRLLPFRLLSWIKNPVGTAVPGQTSGLNAHSVFRFTAAFRLAGAILASGLFATDHLAVGVFALIFSVVTSGLLRFATNAETSVTLRARYISCILGHLGDTLTLLSLTLYLSSAAGKGWVVGGVLSTVAMLFGSLMRTGGLSAGVHVSRIRLERVARVGGIAVGATVAAAGHPAGLGLTFVIVGLWTLYEVGRVSHRVANSSTTHFAWIATSGFEGPVAGGLVTTSPELADDQDCDADENAADTVR